MHFTPAFRGSLAVLAFAALSTVAAAEPAGPIAVPGERAYPESITAGPDGTLYVTSPGSGGVQRVKPGGAQTETWIAPGAFETRSTLGVYADAKAGTLWVCSNDLSGMGVPGPSQVTGSYLKAFDLATGKGTASYKFPGSATFCNDMIVTADGTLYVTNSLSPQIFRLAPGAKELDLFVEDKQFQPPKGAGLDGIAFGGDGNIYVNTFNGGDLFRVEVKNGKAGAVTKLATSRPLDLPDGLRQLDGQTFLMAEGSGSVDRVTIDGDKATIETIKDGLNEPTSLIKRGQTIWVTEGQLSHLFDAKDKGPPSLPFHIVPVPAGD
jgi:sugar lactone lactonase YvrE